MVSKYLGCLLCKAPHAILELYAFFGEQMPPTPIRTIGTILKDSRKAKGWTLRDAENRTRISNGYLSLLESDKIKSPSPTYLAKLASAFDLSYPSLMEAAGYPDMPEPEAENNEFAQRILRKSERAVRSDHSQLDSIEGLANDLSAEEWAQVKAFIEGLRVARSRLDHSYNIKRGKRRGPKDRDRA